MPPGPRSRPRLAQKIVTTTGGLDLWPADAAIPESDYVDSLAAEDVPFEQLDGAEIRRRWPQWHVGDDVRALWQVQGGLADPFKGNAAHRRLAAAHGATLRDNAPVTAIRDAGGGDLEVVTPDATYRTPRVVLTADAWTNGLLEPLGHRLPLTITKEQVTYFACPDPGAFAPDRFPVWIWMDDPCFYGFPTYGEAGPKAAQDCGGSPVDPDQRTFDRDETAFARLGEFMATYLPGAVGPPIYTKTCLYTLTPDRDFVVDRLPDMPGVAVALGCRPRLQVRLGARSRAGRAEHDGLDPVGRRDRQVPDRSADPPRGRPGDLVDGLNAIRAHGARHGLRWTRGCATVPPIRARRAPMRRRRRMRVSLRGRMARVAAVLGLTAALVLPAARPRRPPIRPSSRSGRPRTSTR